MGFLSARHLVINELGARLEIGRRGVDKNGPATGPVIVVGPEDESMHPKVGGAREEVILALRLGARGREGARKRRFGHCARR